MTKTETTKRTKCRYCKGQGINRIEAKEIMVVGGLCGYCKGTGFAPEKRHYSDCAVHNAPALPVGPCDCGGYLA